MNISVYKKSSKVNKRIKFLYLRFLKTVDRKQRSTFKSLGMFEYNSPRNAVERKHNSDVHIKCQRAIFEPENDYMNNSNLINKAYDF